MAGLMSQFGDVVGGIAGQPAVRVAVTGLAIYVVILWLACAYWVFRDLRRRTRAEILPYLASAGVIVASPLLFPFALLVYRIVRPGRTLAEAREIQLEDRIAELQVEAMLACPTCAAIVEEDWIACPACRTKLAHLCVDCGHTMALNWEVCGWCGFEPARPAFADVPQVHAIEKRDEQGFRGRTEAARA
ncbi:MAG TPA: zinc ribbon domain-containing protein [Candidatus Limnocylindrales bacterium]|jgi:hypothetical protein